jgi:hypothetical protein
LAAALDLAEVRYPWLAQWRDRGITELEFRHGCLNSPADRPSLFAFRATDYDVRQAAARPEDADKYGNLTPRETALRQSLEAEVKHTAATYPEARLVACDYNQPEEAAAKVFQHLRLTLEEVLPRAESITSDQRDALSHSAFAAARCALYHGHESLLGELESEANRTDASVVILGPSGSGKSALLANWLSRHVLRKPQDRVFYHFVGCDALSTSLHQLLARLILTCVTVDEAAGVTAASTEELVTMLPLVLKQAADSVYEQGRGRLFIVLDALNQLDNERFAWLPGEEVHRLGWLPEKLPAHVKLIVSSLPGPCQTTLLSREITRIETMPLDSAAVGAILDAVLADAAKRLAPAHRELIVAAPHGANPLYLLLLLEELLAHGRFSTLNERLHELIACKTVPALLHAILTRLDGSFAELGDGTIVATICQLVAVSREGVLQGELQVACQVTTLERPKSLGEVSTLQWTSVFQALSHLFVDKGGRLQASLHSRDNPHPMLFLDRSAVLLA